jgi:hypothetical protein
MPRSSLLSITPEDKRSVAVTLKLTPQENELLTKYAESLDSDKSYVAGKIFQAFIGQALKPDAAGPKARKNGVAKSHSAGSETA